MNPGQATGPDTQQPEDQAQVIKFTKEPAQNGEMVMPTLFGAGYGTYQARPENFILSFLTHVVAIGLLLWLFVAVRHTVIKPEPKLNAIDVTTYMPMHVGRNAGGGGGGGEASKLQASAGAPPKATMKVPIATPVVLVKQESKIMIEPKVVAQLDLKEPVQVGDQLSKLTTASSGTGVSGGIGSGSGGGVGSGNGHGLGAGEGGNFGGGAFRVGNGVSAPIGIYVPDPDYSDEARKAKYQGTVILNVVIGADGRVHQASVARSLGMGLDEKALEKVKLWKFQPATKDGKPVPVQMAIEVTFNLY
ncbi:MAG TPA: energy transducer TonB [Candidatus Angelobacter sp.]|nr:energy transducer TonB [Candidatus Angelobacter sp.]